MLLIKTSKVIQNIFNSNNLFIVKEKRENDGSE